MPGSEPQGASYLPFLAGAAAAAAFVGAAALVAVFALFPAVSCFLFLSLDFGDLSPMSHHPLFGAEIDARLRHATTPDLRVSKFALWSGPVFRGPHEPHLSFAAASRHPPRSRLLRGPGPGSSSMARATLRSGNPSTTASASTSVPRWTSPSPTRRTRPTFRRSPPRTAP